MRKLKRIINLGEGGRGEKKEPTGDVLMLDRLTSRQTESAVAGGSAHLWSTTRPLQAHWSPNSRYVSASGAVLGEADHVNYDRPFLSQRQADL